MNALIHSTEPREGEGVLASQVRVSTKLIAETCEKQHAHVLRDARSMLIDLYCEAELKPFLAASTKSKSEVIREQGDAILRARFRDGPEPDHEAEDGSDLSHAGDHPNWDHLGFEIIRDPRGYISEILFDREHALTVASGYDVRLRKKLIDKLSEMERRGFVDPMKALSDPATMRGLLLSYSETVLQLQADNEALAGKAKALERLEGATGSMCISDAAKTLGVRRNELIDFLQRIRWIFKRPGNKNWLAYDAVRPRYMDHDDHPYVDSEGRDRVSTRALVTAAGLVKLADLLVKHGVTTGGAA